MPDPVKIGISSCLLGNMVRYDGGHRHDPFIVETLGQWVEFVPICPELECGLGVPRETMHLVGEPGQPRLITTRTGVDHTERLLAWAAGRILALEEEGVRGFIFKSRSPSCGVAGAAIRLPDRRAEKIATGLFAAALKRHFPLLPVVEDEWLHDPALRKEFIERLVRNKIR